MFQSLQVAAGAWLLAIYYRQSWKKSKVYKITFFFKMARGGKWLRVAADGCNQLQPLAATCPSSHLPKQPLALAATCSHLPKQPLAQAAACPCSRLPLQPLAATCSHLQPLAQAAASGCKWLLFRKSKWCTFARSLRKQLNRHEYRHRMARWMARWMAHWDSPDPPSFLFRQPPTGDPTLLQQLLRDREHINADAGKPRSADHRRP